MYVRVRGQLSAKNVMLEQRPNPVWRSCADEQQFKHLYNEQHQPGKAFACAKAYRSLPAIGKSRDDPACM